MSRIEMLFECTGSKISRYQQHSDSILIHCIYSLDINTCSYSSLYMIIQIVKIILQYIYVLHLLKQNTDSCRWVNWMSQFHHVLWMFNGGQVWWSCQSGKLLNILYSVLSRTGIICAGIILLEHQLPDLSMAAEVLWRMFLPQCQR